MAIFGCETRIFNVIKGKKIDDASFPTVNITSGVVPVLTAGWYNATSANSPLFLMYIDESDATYDYVIAIYMHGSALATDSGCNTNPLLDCGDANILSPCVISQVTDKTGNLVLTVSVPDSVINNAINSLITTSLCDSNHYELPILGCQNKTLITYIFGIGLLGLLLTRK